MLSINTNLSSLIAQSSMKQSTNELNLAIERMSTGFKVNHAKDNAANYSIATNMTTKINSYMVAEDNAAMGLDLISTAEGTLSQIQDKLSRLRALAEQSANGTYGEQSKQAINAEANALVDEIERLYSTAEYNGKKLLKADSTFLQKVEKVDTTGMTSMTEVDESQVLAQGEYTIGSAADLAKLARMQNAGKITAGSTFVQTANIDLSDYTNGEGWTPIGGGNDGYSTPFKGEYNGNGYTISNLYIDRNVDCQGLFGYCENANFKNVGIINGSAKGKGNIGGLVGVAIDNSVVENCFSMIDVNSSTNSVGGLIGAFNGTMDYCYATGNVYADRYVSQAVGGLLGNCGGIIKNSYATGDVTGGKYVAGLMGASFVSGNLEIENCYSTGTVYAAEGAGFFGGAGAGIILSTFTNCYTTSDVYIHDSTLEEVWISGFNGGTVNKAIYTNCYSTGNIYVDNDYCSVSGFAGATGELIVENCYSTGDIKINDISANTLQEDFVLGYYGNTQITLNNSQSIQSGSVPYTLSFTYDNSDLIFGLQVGINSQDNASRINLTTSFAMQNLNSMRDLGIKAGNYIETVDNILEQVSARQTEFGATSNRLDSVLDEIAIQYDNLVSSRSTIRDADIAEVSASYIQQQILQQAAATLMSTANQTPALALQLI